MNYINLREKHSSRKIMWNVFSLALLKLSSSTNEIHQGDDEGEMPALQIPL